MSERMTNDERTNDERLTEPERATLCRRIDELCAENERLRQENQSIGMAAYDFGYRNGSIHYELEHCPACKNIADLQEALEENVKLRKERDTLCRRIDELCMEVEQLRRTARRIVHCDGSVGHCACSACGGAIDQDDAWCRHCGAKLEDA